MKAKVLVGFAYGLPDAVFIYAALPRYQDDLFRFSVLFTIFLLARSLACYAARAEAKQ